MTFKLEDHYYIDCEFEDGSKIVTPKDGYPVSMFWSGFNRQQVIPSVKTNRAVPAWAFVHHNCEEEGE